MRRRARSLLAALAIVLAGACGSRAATPAEPRGGPSPEPDSPASAASVPAGASPSNPCALEPGRQVQRIDVDGVAREYVRIVGEDVTTPGPVLFVWHGFGSNPAQMLAGVRPEELWTDSIVVAPLGLGRTFEQFGDKERPGFQIHAGELDDRDLRLFDAMLEQLRASGCVDDARVYTTGFSNGGFMSNVLACHRGDRVAAAAPVGGGGPFVAGCGPPVPVLVTHGRADEVVAFRSAEQTWAFWLEHDGCTDRPALPADGCLDVSGCAANTELTGCVFAGGHTWPADQAARIREFLVRHTKPPVEAH